jgi:hypothetical protein
MRRLSAGCAGIAACESLADNPQIPIFAAEAARYLP